MATSPLEEIADDILTLGEAWSILGIEADPDYVDVLDAPDTTSLDALREAELADDEYDNYEALASGWEYIWPESTERG